MNNNNHNQQYRSNSFSNSHSNAFNYNNNNNSNNNNNNRQSRKRKHFDNDTITTRPKATTKKHRTNPKSTNYINDAEDRGKQEKNRKDKNNNDNISINSNANNLNNKFKVLPSLKVFEPTSWISLPQIRVAMSGCSIPIQVNKNEFIVATHNKGNNEYQGILGYDIKCDCWKFVVAYDKNVFKKQNMNFPVSVLNHNNDKLYLLGSSSATNSIMGIDLFNKEDSAKQIQFQKQNDFGLDLGPAMILVGDYVHIVGGLYADSPEYYWKHFGWNWKTNEIFTLCQVDTKFKEMGGFGLIHLKTKNKLMIFGGYTNDTFKSIDIMYTFDLKQLDIDNNEKFSWKKGIIFGNLNDVSHKMKEMKWNKMNNVKMPYPMSYFAYSMTKDEKYLIVIGRKNKNENEGKSGNIYIFDLILNEWNQSKVKIPNTHKENDYRLYSILFDYSDLIKKRNNYNLLSLLVYGLLRLKYSLNNIYIPNDIFSIINKMYSNEWIHLIELCGEENLSSHSKITLDQVLEI